MGPQLSDYECNKAFKKVHLFGHGMDVNETDYYGNLSDDGNNINVNFKKPPHGTNGNKYSRINEDIPLKFKDYCVSMVMIRD